MPPKEAETLEERVFQLEFIQQRQEENYASLHAEMCEAQDTAVEAKELALQTQASINGIPGKVIETLESRRREKRFEFRDWMQLLVAVVMVGAAIYTAIN